MNKDNCRSSRGPTDSEKLKTYEVVSCGYIENNNDEDWITLLNFGLHDK